MAKTKAENLQYCYDVLAAYKYYGRAADVEVLNPSAYQIHLWAADPKNAKDFFGMAKSATDTIQKYTEDEAGDNAIALAEKKPIAELRAFLTLAVEKSKGLI